MASLIRPTRPFRLPPGAEVATKDGRLHVRVVADGKAGVYPLSRDGTKYPKPARKWYALYRDAAGKQRKAPLSANEDAARLMLTDLLKRVEREKAGITDPTDAHRRKPLTTHVRDWLDALAARGRPADYVARKRRQVTGAVLGCGWAFPADLSADRLDRHLAALRAGPKRLGVQTSNDHLQACREFGRWMTDNGRLPRNPCLSLKKLNPETDRRHVRRPLDRDELARLIAATRASRRTVRTLNGADRAMPYQVAALTGYRASELAAVRPCDCTLAADPPAVVLAGDHTKNGKPAVQPIPAALATELRAYLAGRDAASPVWPGTWPEKAARMLRRDAAAAGIPAVVDSRDGPLVLDFHSLRASFATLQTGEIKREAAREREDQGSSSSGTSRAARTRCLTSALRPIKMRRDRARDRLQGEPPRGFEPRTPAYESRGHRFRHCPPMS